MKDTTISASLCLPNEALLFDLDVLYARLQTIPDHRHRRGVRYPLASLLMVGVLAKLAGQDSSRGMAHWAKLHDRRDATMGEDHAQLRMGHAPQMLAVLNNTVLGLLARQGETNIAHARRAFAYHFDKALTALVA